MVYFLLHQFLLPWEISKPHPIYFYLFFLEDNELGPYHRTILTYRSYRYCLATSVKIIPDQHFLSVLYCDIDTLCYT